MTAHSSVPISPPMRDLLGAEWRARIIAVKESPKAPGADHATLVHHRDAFAAGGEPRVQRAVLYLPGFVDAFVQADHAAQWNAAGIEFFGLDMRAHGRSAVGLEDEERIYDLNLRDVEIALAMQFLRESGYRHITLLGHSTGGLQAATYSAHAHAHGVRMFEPDVIILNSPWLDLAEKEPLRSAGTALAHTLTAAHMPQVVVSQLTGFYGQSIHKDYFGEWDFDTTIKRIDPVPVRAGFLSSVRNLQAEVARGLGLWQRILVATSHEYGDGTRADSPTLFSTDVILNPADMWRLAPKLGDRVKVEVFDGGLHDLALSALLVRETYTRTAITFALADEVQNV